jgi:parallel beta-helix repeat protein
MLVVSLFFVNLNFNVKADYREIYVKEDYFGSSDGSADKPYKTIQEAIDIASEGDTIYVFGGLYQENIVIDKKLKIQGGIDGVETIVDSRFDSYYLIEIRADEVTLESITASDADEQTTSYTGALICLKSDNNRIISNFVNATDSYGIYVDSTSKDNIISNNVINNTKEGIYLYSSSTNDIINNKISNCSDYGIHVGSSSNTRLYGNYINFSTTGIYIQNCRNINVTNNTLSNITSYGINLYNGDESILKDNYFYNNAGDGIYLNSPSCILLNNIFKNNRRGITLVSSNCLIKNNTFYNSSATGIYTHYGSNNKIYLNDFIGNSISAKELGSNLWYYETQGNYWDDYGFVDRDFDGIGDRSYSKNGVSDIYPLGYFLKPPNKPSNPNPKDYATGVGLRVTLDVHVEDPDSDELTVYFYKEDGTLIDSETQNPVRRVSNDSNATCRFTLGFNTTFAWYVVVNDSILENQSDPFIFYTRLTPPDNDPPIAEAGGHYYAETNQIIQFNSTGSSDPDGKIDFYRWNFGDGSSEIIQQSPTHAYSKEGTYTVTLTVIDNNGSSDSDTATVFISFGENDPPVANAVVPSTGTAGESIAFNSEGTIDSDGDKLSYFWDFGDGTNSTEKDPTHSYQSTGKYFVTLTVSDSVSYDITSSVAITITKPVSDGIPGFEVLLIVIALLAILLINKKRSKKD